MMGWGGMNNYNGPPPQQQQQNPYYPGAQPQNTGYGNNNYNQGAAPAAGYNQQHATPAEPAPPSYPGYNPVSL